MRKQLGIVASLLFLCASALLWVGCSNNCCEPAICEQPCAPVCAPASRPCPPPCAKPCAPVCAPKPCAPVCAPVCAPAPSCEPLCKVPVRCKFGNTAELQCQSGVIVTGRQPQLCMLGDQYPLDIDVHACIDVCDVVVSTHLPEGVSFIRSTPEAQVEGKKLTWHIGPLGKGECRTAKVFLRCDCEGEQCACFCATAVPVAFCSLLCAKPVLTCEKCGPEEVCPGDPVHYTITVSNRGSCAAEDVVVTDNVPPELEHCSGLRTLTFKLGSLQPCETKKVNVCLTAVQRGTAVNTATVTACNADSTSCQATTRICKECIELVKTGPKEVQIGKNADYTITVTNPGDKPLTEVTVTDTAPSTTSIVAANGATITGNQAVWRLRELKPGEKVNLTLTLTTCTPGCFTNRVNVTNCQGCNACAEATTRWRGRPALNVQICDTEDPICVGAPTSYCITVVNQGSEADSNVVVTARFPKEIAPTAVTGDLQGTINGQTVTFNPATTLGPHQTLRLRVDAKAKESGDARIQVEVVSDSIKTPITQQESTIVN